MTGNREELFIRDHIQKKHLVCPSCKNNFGTINSFSKHIVKCAGTRIEDWFVSNFLGGAWPLCACSCNRKVVYRCGKFLKYATLQCAQKVNKDDVEYRKKVSEGVRGAYKNSNLRQRLSQIREFKWRDSEYHKKMCKANQKSWDNDNGKRSESVSKKLIDYNKDPAVKKHRTEVMKKLWKDPEYAKKVSEGVKRFNRENPEKNAERLRKSHQYTISSYEIKLKEYLETYLPELKFETQKWITGILYNEIAYRTFDFYFPDFDLYLEVDGIYYHGLDRDSGFTTEQLWNMANDREKQYLVNQANSNLVRITTKNVDKLVLERNLSIPIFIELLTKYHYPLMDFTDVSFLVDEKEAVNLTEERIERIYRFEESLLLFI